LVQSAQERLARLGFSNIVVHTGDGTLGWQENAPYDAIVVTAGAPRLPPALLDQLAILGRLVIPVGPTPSQQILLRVCRVGKDDYSREELCAVRFVPLIGVAGW
jgi:protein-L-isoaspartate(D-aspartate) O-methyltransferase